MRAPLLLSLALLLAPLAAPGAETSKAVQSFSVTSVVTHGPLLDDFNRGLEPNFWGGSRQPFQSGGTLAVGYSAAEAFGGTGFALSLAYDVPSAGGYAGCVFPLSFSGGPVDVSAYDQITFRVKGAAAGQNVKIEMRSTSAAPGRNVASLYLSDYLGGGASATWQQVRIPLRAFANLDSLTNVKDFVFVFERDQALASGFATAGTMYLDDVGFDNGVLPLFVDAFGDNIGKIALGGNIVDPTGGGGTHSSTYDAVQFHDAARSMRSQYNVTTVGSYAGFAMIFGGGATGFLAQPVNLSPYTTLRLWLKSSAPPINIKLELVDPNGTRVAFIPGNSTTPGKALATASNWTEYVVNLSVFPGLNKAAVRQFNVIYEHATTVTNRSSTVFFDEIRFE